MTKPADAKITAASPPNGPLQINNVVDFAAQGWTFRIGTAAARAALPSDEKILGLTWQDTDSGGRRYVWDGGAWSAKSWVWGTAYGANSDASGFLTVTHQLGTVPDWAQVSVRNTADDPLNKRVSAIVWGNPTSTQVQLRFRNEETHDYFGVNSFAGYVTVGKN
jgi:hypothetical protein